MRYVSFIHRDDAGYGVSFPDLRAACPWATRSTTPSNGVAKPSRSTLRVFASTASEFRPPRSVDAIKADPELADWREGADLVLIPLLLDRGSSRRVNISLDPGLLEAIDDEARLRHMTRSAFLATAARRRDRSYVTGASPDPAGDACQRR